MVGVARRSRRSASRRSAARRSPLGHGRVTTEHGALPLPAPATVELLRGIPTVPYDVPWETVTPTGAAILATLASAFGPLPALRPLAQGFGAGDDRKGPLPNVLRAVLGQPRPGSRATRSRFWRRTSTT